MYKPCLERGRFLNCILNKVYRLEIYVLTPVSVSLASIPNGSASTPGLQHWHGLEELENYVKSYMLSFQSDLLTAINNVSSPIYKSFCLLHCKNCFDKMCVNIKQAYSELDK